MKEPKWWPWWQQILDAVAAAVGVGLAIRMGYDNSYPLMGVLLVAACIGKLTSSQLLRILMQRWDAKP